MESQVSFVPLKVNKKGDAALDRSCLLNLLLLDPFTAFVHHTTDHFATVKFDQKALSQD